MKSKRISIECYKVEDPKGYHGLVGSFKSVAEAIEELNTAYIRAKERGYDNRHERWAIIHERTVRVFLDGEFLRETTNRSRVAVVAFDESTETYKVKE
jgi:hypothetical protein